MNQNNFYNYTSIYNELDNKILNFFLFYPLYNNLKTRVLQFGIVSKKKEKIITKYVYLDKLVKIQLLFI